VQFTLMKSMREENNSDYSEEMKSNDSQESELISQTIGNESSTYSKEFNINSEVMSSNNYTIYQDVETKYIQKENLNQNNSENLLKKVLKKEEYNIPNANSQQDIIFNKELALDKVCNFKRYFPSYNIHQIIKNFAKNLTNKKEINRKYIKTKYQNLKNYTFYTNALLEKFLKESKVRKENKRNKINETQNTTNYLLNNIKSAFPDELKFTNPLVKINYFGKNQRKSQLSTFADLINILVIQNRKNKIERGSKVFRKRISIPKC